MLIPSDFSGNPTALTIYPDITTIEYRLHLLYTAVIALKNLKSLLKQGANTSRKDRETYS